MLTPPYYDKIHSSTTVYTWLNDKICFHCECQHSFVRKWNDLGLMYTNIICLEADLQWVPRVHVPCVFQPFFFREIDYLLEYHRHEIRKVVVDFHRLR